MSASSNVASSTLTRSRIALLTAATIFTGIATYGLYRSLAYDYERSSLPGTGLHRSNAVHRRRQRNTTDDTDGDASYPVPVGEDEAGNIVPTTLTDGETVVDDPGLQEDLPWREVPSRPYERHGQNIVQLLFRVSEDATRRNAYVHRGCACNSCGVVPIRGIRYRCANCADYDLCESCESQGMHIKTHIFYKVKVPAPSFGPRHIQPVWYSGDPDSVLRVLPKEILTRLSRETGFERPELEAYWEQWTFMANTDWRDDPDDICLAMDRKTFERCLVPSGGYRHSAPSLIFDRMFAFYDTNKDDLIGFPEFLHGIAYRKKKEKWRQIFDGYDIDCDGFVDRRDFLRMFRSYYVLYRQMHRDMLEGMEEQQMSSTEAHRLVNSRQPLSSAFGQDGRYPRAPDPRTGEGKVARSNGDLEIVDGKGVINESSNDFGNREEVFRRDMSGLFNSQWDRNNNPAYWETLLNPPETLGELPRVLNNFERNPNRHRDRLLAELLPQDTSAAQASQLARLDDDTDSSYSYSGTNVIDSNTDQEWPPTFVNVTSDDVQAVTGTSGRVEDVQPIHRRAVVAQAIFREGAHKDVYERWQRRQFYTDEEEGAVPPEDWKEEDDVLANSGIMGESSKVPSRLVHSRSSSKVRFAEDMDDFDTRSNPSTSSRSVPERWGGIEIPDAEKDAGKEILYQVTQQAFNELLDPLFKEKEDLAIECAATQTARDQYRSMYTAPEFVAWAEEREAKEIKKREGNSTRNSDAYTTPIWPNFPEVELEEIREHPLEQLLAATGFQVEVNDNEEMPALEDIPTPDLTQSSSHPLPTLPVSDESSRQDSIDPTPTPDNAITDSPMDVLLDTQDKENEQPQSSRSTPPQATPPESVAGAEPSGHFDLTMPQFRPNGPELWSTMGTLTRCVTFLTPASPESMLAAVPGHDIPAEYSRHWDEPRPAITIDQPLPTVLTGPHPRPSIQIRFFGIPTPGEAEHMRFPIPDGPQKPQAFGSRLHNIDIPTDLNDSSQPPQVNPDSKPPGKDQLYELWIIERAVQESEVRGGWGKLSFVEFERMVKRLVREGKGNQMDYLGSWIDFCIP